MKFRRSGLPFVLIAFFLGSCGSQEGGGCQGSWVSPGSELIGNPAPNFTLSNLASQKTELAKVINEKPALLVFWATWCPSCVEEVPILKSWNEKYPQLQILGINVQEPAQRVQVFVEKEKIRYPILLDENGDVASQYGLVGIPAAVLVAKGGRVLYFGFGLPRNIEDLVKE
ncbi:MAG: TlpA family protein disulfide reductase [Candidatus Omnitrophica bacterium]|nr:TlpA family protein disulfide reductase [Candidatus Omnitrophota bacterium]